MNCIGTPISWLRLEHFAMNSADSQIAEHIAQCKACAGCLDEIRNDVVALPVLVVPERKRVWWHFALPALALAAAALLLIIWPRDRQREDRVAVKGVGEVILGVVRERDGTIRNDATTFLPGDRWKVVLTCPPAAGAWVDVVVTSPGGSDRPLAPAQIACGNRVDVPGAFHLTGSAPNRICVRVAAAAVPAADAPKVCITIAPGPSGSE